MTPVSHNGNYAQLRQLQIEIRPYFQLTDLSENGTGGCAMEDRVSMVSSILHEAAATHHIVYRLVDGNDADWASWYADWMIKLSELPGILGMAPVRSELVYMLVRLDKEYLEKKPDDAWEAFYAQQLVSTFAAGEAAERLPGPA